MIFVCVCDLPSCTDWRYHAKIPYICVSSCVMNKCVVHVSHSIQCSVAQSTLGLLDKQVTMTTELSDVFNVVKCNCHIRSYVNSE